MFFWKYLSWQRAFTRLFKLQSRIFKSVLVGNFSVCLALQKIVFKSNSVFLISIREVTQIDSLRRIPGVDGKICLDFAERFELNEYLKKNFNYWLPSSLKKVLVVKKDGSSSFVHILTISDRCWQTIVKFSLSPAHDASFSFTNFGYRDSFHALDLQRLVLLNLSKNSFGYQKRVLLFNFKTCFYNLDFNNFIKKLYLPRKIKLGVFRFLRLGFLPVFNTLSSSLDFPALLANILFNDIDFISSSFRFGYDLIVFLKPFDNEILVINKVNTFLERSGLNFSYKCVILSPLVGFNFLDWYFFLNLDLQILCSPSFENYQLFLRRIKRIINNSNYNATIKSMKLAPIVRDWNAYNKLATFYSLKFSLFFVKKRSFKVFNSESNQDQYSTKVLLNRCFNSKFLFSDIKETVAIKNHVFLWLDYTMKNSEKSGSKFNDFNDNVSESFLYFCIHCGVRIF